MYAYDILHLRSGHHGLFTVFEELNHYYDISLLLSEPVLHAMPDKMSTLRTRFSAIDTLSHSYGHERILKHAKSINSKIVIDAIDSYPFGGT